MSKNHETSSAVMNYLKKMNRPFSVNDILNNLHKEFGKTAIIKACDDLVANGSVKEKINGKQKVYFINQNQFKEIDDKQLKRMDLKLKESNDHVMRLGDIIKDKESKLSHYKSCQSLAQIKSDTKSIVKEIAELKQKFESLSKSAKNIDPSENEKLKVQRVEYVREWRKRKRMASSMIDAILDGYPKSKAMLLEEIGVETDEDYGVTIPQI